MREKVLKISVISVFCLLLLGIFYIQIIKGRYYANLSKKNRIRVIAQRGARGRIFDRNGTVIVDNYLSFDVIILPQELNDRERVLDELSKIINMDAEDINKVIKRKFLAPFVPITVKEDISHSAMMRLKEAGFNLPGVEVEAVPRRLYPFGSTAVHLIGYLGRIDHQRLSKLKDYGYKREDIVGYSGVEEQYDRFLGPSDGGKQIEVDHKGRFVRLLGYKHSRDGRDITLTIDLRMQQVAEEVLSGHKGAIMIMQPYTGEVLAMVSYPDFNPNIFIKRSLNSQLKGILRNRKSPLLNRAIGGQYAPGSIFKIILAAAGLELKKLDLKTSFYCPGYFQLGSREFGCWSTHEWENISEAIMHSCNVFFYHTGLLLGVDNIVRYADKFGIGRPCGIDIPYEARGILPSPIWKKMTRFKNWYKGDTINLSIGQGSLMMTPIQAVVMISSLANGGKLVEPYLVSNIDSKRVVHKRPVSLSLSPDTVKHIGAALEGVVSSSGTAALLSSIPRISIAGKTGTAQVGRGRQPHAWFIAYAPADDPKVALCILLENAGSSTYSCVLAKELFERLNKEGLL